ncbi:MAG: hypothetical protein JWO83_3969 [Caulobacteraceae bacterium]|nr:hypothetical protein [Caulobacteraceae bacterium]
MIPLAVTVVDFPACAPPPVDHDLQVALSLARANTAALLNLSALSRREIIIALTDEVALLRAVDNRPQIHAAHILTQYLPGVG